MYPKLLWFRYKLFHYRHVERELVSRPEMHRLLDIGCGEGENLLRFDGLPLQRTGLDVSMPRLQRARQEGLDVLCARGESLPFLSNSFDLIYVAHALHHIADYRGVLAEIRRCLAPGGVLFLVETVSDHPLLRLGRLIHPIWRGDAVAADWRYAELMDILRDVDFRIEGSDRYNLLFWLWEMFLLAFWPFEIFTPIFVYLDLLLSRWLKRYSAHCYFVLRPKALLSEER
jgi:ubiquinone/menaquinone biosynthesis C-methylase UbiE